MHIKGCKFISVLQSPSFPWISAALELRSTWFSCVLLEDARRILSLLIGNSVCSQPQMPILQHTERKGHSKPKSILQRDGEWGRSKEGMLESDRWSEGKNKQRKWKWRDSEIEKQSSSSLFLICTTITVKQSQFLFSASLQQYSNKIWTKKITQVKWERKRIKDKWNS